jgi:hypothetical protein
MAAESDLAIIGSPGRWYDIGEHAQSRGPEMRRRRFDARGTNPAITLAQIDARDHP